jgi:hypothetical protein
MDRRLMPACNGKETGWHLASWDKEGRCAGGPNANPRPDLRVQKVHQSGVTAYVSASTLISPPRQAASWTSTTSQWQKQAV